MSSRWRIWGRHNKCCEFVLQTFEKRQILKSSDVSMIQASFGNEENQDNVEEEVKEGDEVEIAATMNVSGKFVA